MSYIDSFQDTVPSPLSPLSPPLLIELSWTDEQGGLAEGNEEVVSPPPPQPSCRRLPRRRRRRLPRWTEIYWLETGCLSDGPTSGFLLIIGTSFGGKYKMCALSLFSSFRC